MDQRLPFSVSLITLNEELNLPRCLESVRHLASEIVVVDSGSTDGTEAVARTAGALFISHPWQGFTRQKNLSLDHCTQPWVLCLDADEAVSPELARSIRQALTGSPAVRGFEVNRLTYFLGGWIRHAWYPEWRVRLVRREDARWTGADPHPGLEVPGPAAKLGGDLFHYSYRDLRDYFERTVRYARTSAENLDRRERRCRWYHLVFSPWLAMAKRLIVKQGFRDGWRGWIIAYATFFSVLAKYAYQYERRAARKAEPETPAPRNMSSVKPTRPDGNPSGLVE
jgi:glycosyltransferase involved in cell wall biosynthesis